MKLSSRSFLYFSVSALSLLFFTLLLPLQRVEAAVESNYYDQGGINIPIHNFSGSIHFDHGGSQCLFWNSLGATHYYTGMIRNIGDGYYCGGTTDYTPTSASFLSNVASAMGGYGIVGELWEGQGGRDNLVGYFKITDSANVLFNDSNSFVPPLTVSLSYPGNGSTTPDFSNWVVDWSGNLPYGNMTVYYGFSTSSWAYQDAVNFSPFVSASPLGIPKHQPLWFIPLSIPATWYAQAVDVGATSTVTSTIITFQVDPNASAPPQTTSTIIASPFLGVAGETSSTLANPTINCQFTSSSLLADPVGNIQAGICNALTFLFIPNSSEQQNLGVLFNNLRTTYSNKPPFGYITKIAVPIQGLSISASSSWPQVVNASTSASFSIVYHTMDSGLATIIYILLGVWVYHEAKTVQL